MTILLTFVPSIVLLLYFTLSDRFKEPKETVLLIFFLGFLICLPAGILNGLSHDFFYDGSKYSENLSSSFCDLMNKVNLSASELFLTKFSNNFLLKLE